MTDPLGQSQVIPYLAGLSAKGHRIWLLSAEKKEVFTLHRQKIQELLNEHSINWLPVSYTKRPPVLSTMFDVWKLQQTAKRIIRKHNIQIIHCRSYISAFVGLTQKKKGRKFIFDMRGFWPDERVDGNIWSLKNPVFKQVYRFFKRKEKLFLSHADAVISLTEAGKNEMLTWQIPGLSEEKISVIPCCADLDFFHYKQVSTTSNEVWRTKLQIPADAFVISYLGSVGTWYMPDEMLGFFKILVKQKPDSIFLFITKDNPEHIYQLTEKNGVQRSQIRIQAAERNQVPELLSVSQAALFFIKPVWSKKASSPTKMAEIMGLGIPIVANSKVGDVDLVMKKNPSGILVESFTNEAYNQAVTQLLTISDKNKPRVRDLACEYFSLENGISIFDTIYRKLR